MRCDEFIERWQSLLDERRDAATDVPAAAHLQSCGACRALAEAFGRGLTQMQPAAAPAMPGLADRVVAALQQTAEASCDVASPAPLGPEVRRRSFMGGRSWPVWAVAASVLLAIGLAWRAGRSGPSIDAGKIPIARDNPTAPIVEVDSGSSVAAASSLGWEEFTVESKTSAKQLVDETRKQLDDALAVATLWNPRREAPETTKDEAWYGGVAEGLSPLTQSTIGTWNTLRGLVAPTEEPKL